VVEYRSFGGIFCFLEFKGKEQEEGQGDAGKIFRPVQALNCLMCKDKKKKRNKKLEQCVGLRNDVAPSRR